MSKTSKTSSLHDICKPIVLLLIIALFGTGCATFTLHNIRGYTEARENWHQLAVEGYGGARLGISEGAQDFALQQAAVLWHACGKLEEIYEEAQHATEVRKHIVEATESEIALLEHEMNNACAVANPAYNQQELENRRDWLYSDCGCSPISIRTPSNFDADCGVAPDQVIVLGTLSPTGATLGAAASVGVLGPVALVAAPVVAAVAVLEAQRTEQCEVLYDGYVDFYRQIDSANQACEDAKTRLEDYKKESDIPGTGKTYDIYGDYERSDAELPLLLANGKSDMKECEIMKAEIGRELDEAVIQAELAEMLTHHMLPTNPNFDQDIEGTQGDSPGYVPPGYVPPP